MARDEDTKGAAPALPPSCATAPGLVRAHLQGMGFACSSSGSISCSAALNIPNSASSRSRAPSQQRQGSFPSPQHLLRARRILWKAPTTPNSRAPPGPPTLLCRQGTLGAAEGPEGFGSQRQQRSHRRIHRESQVAQSPPQSCPVAQIPPAGSGATENNQPRRMAEPQ